MENTLTFSSELCHTLMADQGRVRFRTLLFPCAKSSSRGRTENLVWCNRGWRKVDGGGRHISTLSLAYTTSGCMWGYPCI